MKLLCCKLVFTFVVLTGLVSTAGIAAETAQAPSAGQQPKEPVSLEAPSDPNIVARMGDYMINREELEQRLLRELQPNYYESPIEEPEPVDAEKALKKILAEKAIMIEARNIGRQEDETIAPIVQRDRDRKLATQLLRNQILPKVNVTQEEVDERLKADPNLDPARVRASLERAQGNKLVAQYYDYIYKKLNVQKVKENYPVAIQINNRLLKEPKKPRKLEFVHKYQIKEEMTQQERDIVLATYDGGKITIEDWIETLCGYAPPSRPKLDTADAVDKLVETSLRVPLYVKEAESQGLDKDKDLLAQTREYEDRILLNDARKRLQEKLQEPNDAQVKAFFDEHKEAFGVSKRLQISQIWCKDKETAQKVREKLDSGEEFEALKKEYNLNDKARESTLATLASEGLFWDELWSGEPNDIIGPVKGFLNRELKWRIVKILEKIPWEPKEFDENMKKTVKNRMLGQMINESLDKYGMELLDKYPYKIYADRIKDINLLNIP